MTEKEAGQIVLMIADMHPTYAQTKDDVKRKARMWHRIIGQRMTFEEAERYLLDHYQESRYIPMPADIVQRWKEDFDPDQIVPPEPPEDMRGDSV